MTKKSLFLLSLWCVYLIGPAYLACAETITLSTYYPAPYGVYKDFEVKERAAVGDIAQSADFNTVGDLKPGQLYVAQGTIYNPLTGTPATGNEGELVYVDNDPTDTAPGEFYYYGGGAWVAQGGGSGGASYVAWGQTNCNDINGNNNGYKVAYTGIAAAGRAGQAGAYIGGIECIPRNLMVGGGGAVEFKWYGGDAGGGNTLYRDRETPCAVCVK